MAWMHVRSSCVLPSRSNTVDVIVAVYSVTTQEARIRYCIEDAGIMEGKCCWSRSGFLMLLVSKRHGETCGTLKPQVFCQTLPEILRGFQTVALTTNVPRSEYTMTQWGNALDTPSMRGELGTRVKSVTGLDDIFGHQPENEMY